MSANISFIIWQEQLLSNAAPVSPLSIVLLSIIMTLVVIIVVIIASVIVIYYKKKKTDEYDYVETYLLPSNPNTRGHIVATSGNPAYPASTPTQPTVPDELSTAEQTTTAIYEDIPQ